MTRRAAYQHRGARTRDALRLAGKRERATLRVCAWVCAPTPLRACSSSDSSTCRSASRTAREEDEGAEAPAAAAADDAAGGGGGGGGGGAAPHCGACGARRRRQRDAQPGHQRVLRVRAACACCSARGAFLSLTQPAKTRTALPLTPRRRRFFVRPLHALRPWLRVARTRTSQDVMRVGRTAACRRQQQATAAATVAAAAGQTRTCVRVSRIAQLRSALNECSAAGAVVRLLTAGAAAAPSRAQARSRAHTQIASARLNSDLNVHN